MTQNLTRRRALSRLATMGLVAAGVSVTDAGTVAADASYTRTDFTTTSWDGTDLVGSLYVPDSDGPHPVVLGTHGWGGDHGSPAVARRADVFARNGYVFCAYDSRGFGESGGEVGVDGPNEVADALTLLDQLAEGDVGGVSVDVERSTNGPVCAMDGLSYAGGIQLNTMAVSSPDAADALLPDSATFDTIDFTEGSPLDAAVPRWAWHDLRFSLAPRGVVKVGWDSLLLATGIAGARGLTSGDGQPSIYDLEYGVTEEVPDAFVTSTAQNEFDSESAAFYASRSPVSKTALLETPTLLISSWTDTLFITNEAIWNYHAIRDNGVESKLVLFRGGHTFEETADAEMNARLDSRALEFIDAHLRRDEESGFPQVEYYETQRDTWSTTNDIDPRNTKEWTVTFSDAKLDDETVVYNSIAPSSTSQLTSEEEDLLDGVTAVHFDYLVTEARELLGAPSLELDLEPLGTDPRLFVKVYHRTADGETLVHDQVTPVHQTGDERRTVEVEMTALQRRLAVGDTLRVTVAATDAGFYSSRTAAGARIYHGSDADSRVTFPVQPS
ncbi:CocE/NonD family hydrolase [Haladaptatus sp. ZSTT2]|uniref:CocE/NonD family hydrolase n=1 Tax=Haladaptatus sp. ZSTT2 TaxID=3120515 RepID=UPI00300F61DF